MNSMCVCIIYVWLLWPVCVVSEGERGRGRAEKREGMSVKLANCVSSVKVGQV